MLLSWVVRRKLILKYNLTTALQEGRESGIFCRNEKKGSMFHLNAILLKFTRKEKW